MTSLRKHQVNYYLSFQRAYVGRGFRGGDGYYLTHTNINIAAHFDDLTSDRDLSGGDRKDELADILNNLEFSKDVEEMFKGVLTDESQVKKRKYKDCKKKICSKYVLESIPLKCQSISF